MTTHVDLEDLKAEDVEYRDAVGFARIGGDGLVDARHEPVEQLCVCRRLNQQHPVEVIQ